MVFAGHTEIPVERGGPRRIAPDSRRRTDERVILEHLNGDIVGRLARLDKSPSRAHRPVERREDKAAAPAQGKVFRRLVAVDVETVRILRRWYAEIGDQRIPGDLVGGAVLNRPHTKVEVVAAVDRDGRDAGRRLGRIVRAADQRRPELCALVLNGHTNAIAGRVAGSRRQQPHVALDAHLPGPRRPPAAQGVRQR